MDSAVLSLIILVIMAVFFVIDKVPMALVAMSGAVICVILGLLPVENLFSAFSGNTIVLITAMMVIGSSLFHTGLAEEMSKRLVKLTGTTENGIMFSTVVVAALISSIASGVAVVAMLLPIVIGMSMKAKVSVSRQLIPLSFAASFGCNLTLLGAASNVVVSGQMETFGAEPLTFLGIGKVGLPILIVSLVYFMTIGKKFLTEGDSSDYEYLSAYMGSDKEKNSKEFNKTKATLSLIILAVVLVTMIVGDKRFPLHIIATIGALLMVATNCISEQEAYRAIDTSTLFIVAGMGAVSKAIDVSGGGKLLTNTIINFLGDSPSKFMVLLVIYLLTLILTNILMNTSTALLVTPLFIPLAQGIGMNTTAVGIAICIAASSPFLSPVGSGTNTLVIRPGNLKFMDFFRPGLGLAILIAIISLIVIPIAWPL